jgi:hypothetical protein
MGAKIAILAPEGGGASFRLTLSRDVTGLRASMHPGAPSV